MAAGRAGGSVPLRRDLRRQGRQAEHQGRGPLAPGAETTSKKAPIIDDDRRVSRVYLVLVRSGYGASPCTEANRMEWERKGFIHASTAEHGVSAVAAFHSQVDAAKHALDLERDHGW